MLYAHLIWRQLQIVATHLVTIGRIVFVFAKNNKIYSGIGVAVFVALIGGLVYFFGGSNGTPTLNDARAVNLLRVGDVSKSAPLSLIGSVRATREANISPDTPGTVSAIYRNLGDYVSAGTIIAELKNDTQRAAVAQARAAVQKTQSAVAVGGIGVENAQSSFDSAIDAARATVQTAYASINDGVRRKADAAFSNPTSAQPHFSVSTSNSQLVNTLEGERVQMQAIIVRHSLTSSATMNADQLLAELTTLSSEVKTAQDFMQDLVSALNSGVASASVSDAAIAGFRADASLGLSSVNGLASSLASAIEILKAKRAGVTIAETNLATGSTGESADIAGANANLSAALAQLEKTLIRAPISGTINSLNLDVGSFVNASVPVVYITSAGGLEVVAYVSGNDLGDIAVGAQVKVGQSVTGSVARVASALDPLTKKAEIRISIPPSAPLVSGQSATVLIDRTIVKASKSDTISVPLSAIKITPETPLVFTVNDARELVGNPVVLGTLRGDKIEIKSGVTADMVIVEDARGLKEGQVVIVNP